jgi:hypothetical protein
MNLTTGLPFEKCDNAVRSLARDPSRHVANPRIPTRSVRVVRTTHLRLIRGAAWSRSESAKSPFIFGRAVPLRVSLETTTHRTMSHRVITVSHRLARRTAACPRVRCMG